MLSTPVSPPPARVLLPGVFWAYGMRLSSVQRQKRSLSKNGQMQTPALEQCQGPRVPEDSWEMIKHVTFIVHFISNLMLPLIWQHEPVSLEVGDSCSRRNAVLKRLQVGLFCRFLSVRRGRGSCLWGAGLSLTAPDPGAWPSFSAQGHCHLEMRHCAQRLSCGHTALVCYVQQFLYGNSNWTCYLQGLCTQPTIGKKNQLLLLFSR